MVLAVGVKTAVLPETPPVHVKLRLALTDKVKEEPGQTVEFPVMLNVGGGSVV